MADQEPAVQAAEDVSVESLRGSRPSTDVNLFIMLAVGLIGTLAVSFAVAPLKGHKIQALNYLDGIINRRGPVQWVELVMSFMVLAMIILKNKVVKRNLNVIASHPVPADLDLNDDRALQDFRDSLPKRPEFGWSILLNRLDRAIALWLSSKDVGRVATWASTESSRDQSSSDSSYALSRVLMWAIPILGFIGTVQGLGSAVAGFGVLGGSAGIDAIKGAIGQVTQGLGVAFDTTLLALILTTILMFPLTSFQRQEENLFGEFDNYIDDVLLSRFPSPEQKPIVIENLEDSIEGAFRRYIPDPDRYDEVFTRAIDRAAVAVQDRFAQLSRSYEGTLKEVTERLGHNLSAMSSGLAGTLTGIAVEMRKHDEAMLAARRTVGEEETSRFRSMVTEMNAATERVTHQSLSAAHDLTGKMAEVAKMAAGIQELLRINQAVEKGLSTVYQSEDFRKTMDDLRRNLNATSELCVRLSKPRVVTFREE